MPHTSNSLISNQSILLYYSLNWSVFKSCLTIMFYPSPVNRDGAGAISLQWLSNYFLQYTESPIGNPFSVISFFHFFVYHILYTGT